MNSKVKIPSLSRVKEIILEDLKLNLCFEDSDTLESEIMDIHRFEYHDGKLHAEIFYKSKCFLTRHLPNYVLYVKALNTNEFMIVIVKDLKKVLKEIEYNE